MFENEIYFVVDNDKLFKGFLKDKETILNVLTYNKYESVKILKSNNPTSVEIPPCRVRSEKSPLSYYPFTDDFKDQFGPFEEVETIDLNSYQVNEAVEDVKDEFLIHLRSIKGMKYAYKVGDDEYVMCMR